MKPRPRLIVLAALAALMLLVAEAPGAEPAMPQAGQPAPNFQGQMVYGGFIRPIKLADYKGYKLVLYFYPKDNTPGCTKEACAFRDGIDEIKKRGAVIIGVSADSVDSHKKFRSKFDLNFPLL